MRLACLIIPNPSPLNFIRRLVLKSHLRDSRATVQTVFSICIFTRLPSLLPSLPNRMTDDASMEEPLPFVLRHVSVQDKV